MWHRKHLAKYYEQKQDEPESKQNDQEKSKEKSVKISGVQNSGLFVTAFVNDQPVTCLLDTGATLTIISAKVWETLDRSSLTLSTFDQVISTASGRQIEVKGKPEVQIKVAESS